MADKEWHKMHHNAENRQHLPRLAVNYALGTAPFKLLLAYQTE
jgi:hypothetical protein